MDAIQIIKAFGGTRKVAQIFGVTDGAVSQWKKNGIPKACMLLLQHKNPDIVNLTEKKEAA